MTGPQLRRTSDVITYIAKNLGDGQVTISNFMAMLTDRAFGLAILVFALPNTPPLGIPGISSICAVPIMIFSLQMVIGRHSLWLPGWIGKKTISAPILAKALMMTVPAVKKLEILLKPRILAASTGMVERLVGLLIFLHAVIIFLPIPGGNFLPAICMCVLALGMLERDGVCIIAGLIASAMVIVGMPVLIWQGLLAAYQIVISFL